jgi:hypothetical protein
MSSLCDFLLAQGFEYPPGIVETLQPPVTKSKADAPFRELLGALVRTPYEENPVARFKQNELFDCNLLSLILDFHGPNLPDILCPLLKYLVPKMPTEITQEEDVTKVFFWTLHHFPKFRTVDWDAFCTFLRQYRQKLHMFTFSDSTNFVGLIKNRVKPMFGLYLCYRYNDFQLEMFLFEIVCDMKSIYDKTELLKTPTQSATT